MLKKLMISAAVSALMLSGAMAQANPPAPPPAKSDAMPSEAKFIAAQGADQWVFSKFRGTDVIGPDDAKVGDVSDLLLDRSGKVLGVIVGVGGFLGIGEKSVAIDLSAFQVVPADTGRRTGTNTTVIREPDPTAVRLKVSWTKDQLKNAPDFHYYKAPSSTTGMTTPRPIPPMPPRQ